MFDVFSIKNFPQTPGIKGIDTFGELTFNCRSFTVKFSCENHSFSEMAEVISLLWLYTVVSSCVCILHYRGYYIRATAVNHCLVTFLKTFADCRTQVNLPLIFERFVSISMLLMYLYVTLYVLNVYSYIYCW